MSQYNGMQWWQLRFAVERACTCSDKCLECLSDGFHVVDSWDTEEQARADAAELQDKTGISYRVVDQNTGKQVW